MLSHIFPWLGDGKEAMVLTPEFHTLGAPKPVGPRAPETQTVAKGPPRSYKAFAGWHEQETTYVYRVYIQHSYDIT